MPRQHASSSADRASRAVEKKLAGVLGVPHVVSCANGTDALLVALQALGVKRGMKVALPNLTFWATFEAVAQLGAIPVLVDIDPDDLQVSLDELRSAHDAHRFDAADARPPLRLDVGAPRRDSCILQGAQTSPSSRTARSASASRRSASRSSPRPTSRRSRSTRPRWSAARWTAARSPCSRRSTRRSSAPSATTVAPITTRTRTSAGTRAWAASRPRSSRACSTSVPAILESRRTRRGLVPRAPHRGRRASKRVRVFGPPAGVVENGYLNVLTVEGKRGQEVVDALEGQGHRRGAHLPRDDGRAAAGEGRGRDRPRRSAPLQGLLREGREPPALLRNP